MKNVARLIVLIAALSATSGFSFELVRDGKPTAIIVLADDSAAAAREGARILTEHIEQISGAKLETIRESQLTDDRSNLILVGQSGLTADLGATAEGLGPGGILIKTYPSALVLLGSDQLTPEDTNGTRYAVTTFLEDELGVRFLWPGELGKIVPKRKTIEIGEIDHRKTPLLVQRKIRMGGTFGDRNAKGAEKLGVTGEDWERLTTAAKATEAYDAGWGGFHRMGGSLRLASGHAFGHVWEKYGEKHPEWFAMAPNGSRDQSASPHRARLCVSNPDLANAIADELIAKIDESGQKSVAIGPNDGGTTSFCTCPKCEALDAPSERKITLVDFSPGANRRQFEHVPLTDRYVQFWNRIADRVTAKHPDTWLTADAYSVYRYPPVKAKLHPNVAIRYVGVTYLNDERRLEGLADWGAWRKAASKIYFRSNMLLAGRRQGTAVVYIHKLADDFSKLAPNRMIGTDLDSCMHHWATQGLNYYVMAKLLWSPDLDIDALLDDYCRAGFGDGADAVKRYFLRVEALTNEIAANQLAVYNPFRPEAIEELRAMLDEADKATSDSPDDNRRVAFLRVGLEYTADYSSVFHAYDDWIATDAARLSPEVREAFRTVIETNWESTRHIFENHPTAVNTTSVAWGSWGYFRRMGWNEPSQQLLDKWRR